MKRINWLLFGFFALANLNLSAQNQKVATQFVVENGDTIPYRLYAPISVSAKLMFTSKRDKKTYDRLYARVKKVYPYAREAGKRFKELEGKLVKANSDFERKRITKETEKVILSQFEKQLKDLTFSEGALLLKLVDRETSYSSYELLKEFRGTFQAAMWQGVARVFGHNLKSEYDPYEDRLIEVIIRDLNKA